jgi:hypothetical protein
LVSAGEKEASPSKVNNESALPYTFEYNRTTGTEWGEVWKINE